jgi:hypothetical protein
MATIPIDQVVKVNPSVLAAAGSAIDLNGLILTQSTYAPIGTVQQFATQADVAAYFGASSTEAAMATIYFKGPDNATKTPGVLLFAQYPESAVAGYLRGGSLATMTLTQLQALSGTLTVSVDGTPHTSSSISLSAAASFSNAATIIAAGFTGLGATVTFDSVHSAFVITSSTTGTSSSVSFASGTLAAGLKLDSADGAVTSAGAAAASPGTFMDALILVTQNWGLFTTTWEPATSEGEAFSSWTAGKSPRYGFVGIDSDPNAEVAGNTTTWGYYVQSNALSGTVLMFGDNTHAAFVLSFAASLDFNRKNGRATLAFKSQTGLIPSVTNASNASALQLNGYNFYGAYANAKQTFVFTTNGAISGAWKWLDSYLNQIWLNANLQLSIVTLLTQVGAVPYNAKGYTLIEAACLDPILAAVNFGAIQPGVTLSASQAAQVNNAAGIAIDTVLSTRGWYLQIVPATAAIRAQRASPSMTLWYTDGGSVQQVTLASIEVM